VAEDEIAFTVVVPASGAGPSTVHVEAAALTIAVVDRGHVGELGADWDSPGVYILFQQADGTARNRAYVGKATGLRKRLQGHERNKEGWGRAILVARDTRHGFNSAQVGWLEGRIWELVQSLPDLELENKQRPADDTLRSFDLAALEQMVLPIERVMRFLGFTTGTESPAVGKKRRAAKSIQRHETTVHQLLEAGLLAAGAELTTTMPKYNTTAQVTGSGAIEWKGTSYPSPSSAGCAVRDGKATNGWTFWRLADGRTLADVRGEFATSCQ
jgi:hypothetical protein